MIHIDRKLLFRLAQLAAIAVAAVSAVALVGPGDSSTSYRPVGESMPIPEDQLAPVNIDEFDGILVGLRGTPVVVNIWASWCAPCRTEMPLLERAARDYEGRVVFLGVASQDAPREAREFLDEIGVTYPNVFDRSGDIGDALDQRGFPTTYLFDAEGELRETVLGGISESKLAAQLDDLVG